MQKAALLLAATLLVAGTARAEDVIAVGLDAVTTPGHPVLLRAKFTKSGLLKKPLKDEVTTFDALGKSTWTRTSSEGFAQTSVDPQQAGTSEFRASFARDGAIAATGRVFVLDSKKPVAVVDLDGTLSDMAEWRVPFQGERAAAFPGAADVLTDLARTHEIVYLTARDDKTDRITRGFLAKNHFPDGPIVYDTEKGKKKLDEIQALKTRGVNVALGVGEDAQDQAAYEKAGIKSYLFTKKPGAGPSVRFGDYSALRRQLEKDGLLPPSPKSIGEGTWKYSYTLEGVRHDGTLEATLRGATFDVQASDVASGESWVGRGTIAGQTFTVDRTLTTGVVGSFDGLRSAGTLEYVATLNAGDSASVSVFKVVGSKRTEVGKGDLTRPAYFNEHRNAIDDAITAGDDAILKLSADVLADATADEKVAMIDQLESLGDDWVTFGARNLNPLPIAKAKQKKIVALLESAKDAASFDRIFFRLNEGRLLRALTGGEDAAVRSLIAKWHATAKPGDWEGYTKYLDAVSGTESSGRNSVDFLVDGATVIPAVLAAVDAAKESINLSVYEFDADTTGFQFARKLVDKAKQGVKVRVLIDANGTGVEDKWKDLVHFLQQNGVEVVVNPTPITKNNLDHRKLMVIDGKVGFTGGMNIGDNYQKTWHDQQTRLEGPVVAKLQDAFLERWTAEGGTPPLASENLYPPLDEKQDGTEMRIVEHNGSGADRNIKAAYLRAIDTADKSIRIATPYFSDQDVIDALCAASKRGVQVQVVLPALNDVKTLKETAAAYYPQLLAAGVQVYEYQGRMAHEKVATIDGVWSTAGSSNLDARSLEFNDELNYVIVDPSFAQKVSSSLFDKDLASSTRVTQASSGPKSWFLRLVSPWL